jgi:hypothetical protein
MNNNEKRFCLECEGELDPLDNMDSHTNPRVCIKIIREKLEELESKYPFLKKRTTGITHDENH